MFTGIVEDLGEVEAIDHQGDFARIYVRSSVVTSDARPGDSICVSGVCLTVTGLLGGSPLSPLGEAARPPVLPAHEGAARPPIPPRPPRGFTADVMGETLRHSSLKSLSPGTKVNLERSVRLEDRLGGHLVQGHTDGTGTIQSRVSHADWDVVRVSLPPGLARYVVHKGSITVDGVSLTVSALSPGGTTPPNPPAHGGHQTSRMEGSRPPSPPAPIPPGGGHLPPIPPGGGLKPPASPGFAGDWFEISLIPETLKRTTLGTRQPGDEVNLEVDVIAKYVERLTGGTR